MIVAVLAAIVIGCGDDTITSDPEAVAKQYVSEHQQAGLEDWLGLGGEGGGQMELCNLSTTIVSRTEDEADIRVTYDIRFKGQMGKAGGGWVGVRLTRIGNEWVVYSMYQ